MHNSHHDGNHGHFLTPAPLKYCWNRANFYTTYLNLKKLKQKKMLNHFQLVFQFKYNYSYSKNMQTMNSLDAIHPAWPNDIGLDEKSKQDIKNLYRKGEPSK